MNQKGLQDEFAYYLKHQEELASEYDGKVVAIVGDEVKGIFDSEDEAIEAMLKKYKLGTFLIQRVGRGEENYTSVFHSRVKA